MRQLIEKLAALLRVRMWQRLPDDFFYTPFTPRETDEIVLSLVKSGNIPPDAKDKRGNTLLRSTVMKMNADPGFYADAMRTLLEAGAHPDNDALIEAVKSRSLETVKTLLDAGAQPDSDTLSQAIVSRNVETVRLLIEAGAEPDEDTLEMAMATRHIEMMLVLSRPTEILELLLNYAYFDRDKDFEAVDALLKAGADPSLALASRSLLRPKRTGSTLAAIVKMLLDAGANINAIEGGRSLITDGQTILHKIIYERAGNADFVRMLIDRGADVNVQDRDGYTPLMSACVRESGSDIVAALLDAGANLDTQTKHGKTALFFAAGKNDLDVLKLLLDRGADPNIAERKGNTPLIKAVMSHTENDFVDELLKAGANPNIVNSEGDTALTLALAKRKNPNIAASLVEHGADPSFVRSDGETAFMMMAKRYCDEVLAMIMALLRYNPDTKEMEEVDDAELPLDFVNAQDVRGDTAIIKAVRDNKGKGINKDFMIDMMLLAGCDKNIANNEGKNAVYYAMEKFTDKKKALDGETMLMTFARTFNRKALFGRGDISILYEMMDNTNYPITPGVSAFMVNAQDSNGDTALIKAVRDNPCKTSAKLAAIRVILALGADPNIANSYGKTALYYAMEAFTRGKALDGETVLMTFARTCKWTSYEIDLLLADTAPAPAFEVNAQDANGDTALIIAVRDNPCKTSAKLAAIRVILALGADPNIANSDGKRASDYASQDIKALLEQGGTN